MLGRIHGRRLGQQWALNAGSPGSPGLLTDRVIDILAGPSGEFPVPPARDAGRWANASHAVLCQPATYEAIAQVYRRILNNDPAEGDVSAFGLYLAEALLGPNLDALERQGQPIDLRLRLNDPSLERLPWEMIHSASGPLAARAGLRFSITREVQRTADAVDDVDVDAPLTALELSLPLKVLFVIGATIDPVLRPGAEFLGLLRHLRVPTDPTYTQFRNANVHIRYLGDADIDALKDVCRTFRPSVVHFICHGERNPATRETQIILKRVVNQLGQRVTERLPLTSAELFDAFVESGEPPPSFIVLNACYGGGAYAGQSVTDDGHLPFAADLVKRGVPVAVGMAGEVDDRACQLFALRFYQALLAQESITVATSQARRAVLVGWPVYRQSIEWVRPTLFVRSGIDPIVTTTGAARLDIVERAGRFRVVGKAPRMLCDRYEVFAAAQQLLEGAEAPGNDRLLLALRVGSDFVGIGKTRLLEELAVRSIFEGFIPVILRAVGDLPQTFLEFALATSEAIDEAREHLELESRVRTNARLVAFDVAGVAAPVAEADFKRERHKLRQQLRALTPSGGTFEAGLVREAIRDDCASLAADAQARTGSRHRVLLLIDELHRYSGAITAILDSIQYAGFGTPNVPIPVVINYVDATPEGGEIRQHLQHLPLGRRLDLQRFESDPERELAYRQLMVSTFNVVPNKRRDRRAEVELFLKRLYAATGGRPIEFTNPKIEFYIDGVKQFSDVVVDANFEDLLQQHGGS